MRQLFIDKGHSRAFPGAIGVKNEVDWVRGIVFFLEGYIDRKKYQVVEVPDAFLADVNANLNLYRRIQWINARSKPGDLLLSVHANSAMRSDVRGVTTCYYGGSKTMQREAVRLSQSYAKWTGVPVWNGGSFPDTANRYGRLGMVRDTKPWALLIEAGFVTNPLDMKVNIETAARGIADYYNAIV